MKIFALLFLTSMVYAAPQYNTDQPSYPGSTNNVDYGGQTSETKCTPYFETVQSDHCESYTERTCITSMKESCADVGDQNCRAVISSNQVRKCFNVTEERCALVEQVKFETIQVPFVVQKCNKVNERVCDTVYETTQNIQDKNQCVNIKNPFCSYTDDTIYDNTCRTTTVFDCETTPVDPVYPTPAYPSPSGYNAASTGGNYGSSDSSYGSATTGYGTQKTNCRRTQDTKCYKTPRTISTQHCTHRSENVCEKLSESVPSVIPRQNCHNEEKKICELEERSQPKEVKKYVYDVQCRQTARSVCDNADEKRLVPSCVPTTRKQCTYSPVEKCSDEPKQHCFKVNTQVRKEKCETYPSPTPSYPTPTPSYPTPTPSYPTPTPSYPTPTPSYPTPTPTYPSAYPA